jgi:hypothetical protein
MWKLRNQAKCKVKCKETLEEISADSENELGEHFLDQALISLANTPSQLRLHLAIVLISAFLISAKSHLRETQVWHPLLYECSDIISTWSKASPELYLFIDLIVLIANM